MRFVWDPWKAKANERKHGVTFEEAQTAFLDDAALVLEDPNHSAQEARFVLLGVGAKLRPIVVCHCARGDAAEIRIISARKANRSERRQYEQRRRR